MGSFPFGDCANVKNGLLCVHRVPDCRGMPVVASAMAVMEVARRPRLCFVHVAEWFGIGRFFIDAWIDCKHLK